MRRTSGSASESRDKRKLALRRPFESGRHSSTRWRGNAARVMRSTTARGQSSWGSARIQRASAGAPGSIRSIIAPASKERRLRSLSRGWIDQRYSFAPATPVNAEIAEIGGDNGQAGMQLAEPEEAEVRQIGFAVRVLLGQLGEARQVCGDIELRLDQAFLDKGKNQGTAAQLKGAFRQHGVARNQGFSDLLRDFNRPVVMVVVAVAEANQETGIGYCLHGREKPLRLERSLGPSTAPARRRNGRF